MEEEVKAPTPAPQPNREAPAPTPQVTQPLGNAFAAAQVAPPGPAAPLVDPAAPWAGGLSGFGGRPPGLPTLAQPGAMGLLPGTLQRNAGPPEKIPLPPVRPKNLRPPDPRATFDAAFAAQGDRTIDPNQPRWRALSAQEAEPYLSTPAEFRAQPGQPGYHATVGNQTWLWGNHAVNPENPLKARDMMGPNAKQVFSRAFPTANAADPKKQDVTVLQPNGTTSVLAANQHNMTELPVSGYGFTTHHRNDVLENGKAQPDQWGSATGVARTMNMLADYRTMFPGSSIAVGDLSTDTGNSPLTQTGRTTRHATHYEGTQADMQYPQGTGSTNKAPATADDLFRTRSLVRIAEQNGMNRFYTDPGLHAKGLYTAPGTSEQGEAHHADHIHVGQGTGRRVAPPAEAPPPATRAARIRRRKG